LQSGEHFGPVTVAYETYGEANPDKNNTILLFHALSGSQHAAGISAPPPGIEKYWTDDCRLGWWDAFIGPGRALDTTRYQVICANYFGGCYGSTGPSSMNQETGRPYGSSFPDITASDIVDAQIRLLDHLGIQKLHAAIGASLGGMLAINLATRYPDRVSTLILMATGLRVTMLQRIHNFEQICAIEEDPSFQGGDYYNGPTPDQGLALARMISHKTFVSLSMLEQRARGEIIGRKDHLKRYALRHPVESYLLHQARKFVARFDANTYLKIMQVWQDFDLLKDTGASSPHAAFARCKGQRYLVFSTFHAPHRLCP